MAIARLVALGDTHDQFSLWIKQQIAELKPKPDILAHCGDFETQATYDECVAFATLLQADFFGVRGDHDELPLEEKLIFTVNGYYIGLIHGCRSNVWEKLSTYLNRSLQGRFYIWLGFARYGIAQFGEKLHFQINGHAHVPRKLQIGPTWVINPGAIVVNNRGHHLKQPTLTVVDFHNGGVEPSITFFKLKKGHSPSPIEVGRNGPIKGWRYLVRQGMSASRTRGTPHSLSGTRSGVSPTTNRVIG